MSPYQLDRLEVQAVVKARWQHDWAGPGYKWHEATSDASDSIGGNGGRVATYEGSTDHLGYCYTQRFEASQWKSYCKQLEAIDMPMQIGARLEPWPCMPIVCHLRKDAGWQGQHEGQDFVLMCLPLKRKVKKLPVSRENRDMKVRVLPVDHCKPISTKNSVALLKNKCTKLFQIFKSYLKRV